MTAPMQREEPQTDGLELASRLVGACPAPALMIEEGGSLLSANSPARELLRLDGDLPGTVSIRQILGVGWRELMLISRTLEDDLVVDLPPTAGGRRRGTRVRVEPVSTAGGAICAVVAFLDESPDKVHRPSGGASFDSIFGHDPVLLAAKEAASRFARTQLPVLLLAETGTGKELLARALYEQSDRSSQPFVAINCGALSPHLLESELFGYAPGAFTGASREGHDGKIGAARGGTLFLDEVAEMPPSLQALLLRVLEDGTYYRVGENRPRQADVRLICATCRDLPALVRDGGFREDLYYRINGACLSLPPVRRRTDVADLAEHLLDKLARESGQGRSWTRRPRLSTGARSWMLSYSWPGNVRQLKTALQHALILCDGEEIGLEHLPVHLEGSMSSPGGVAAGTEADGGDQRPAAPVLPSRPAPPSPPPATERHTLAEREAQRLIAAVEGAGGNLSRAARELGLARSTLYRRLRKHGLIS